MSYGELYAFCQTLAPPISTKLILPKACALTGQQVKIIGDPRLNTEFCRGYFLSAKNTGHRLVQMFGKNVIAIAEQNRCWRRLVTIKEAMHLFDDQLHMLNNGDELETLLREFTVPLEPGSTYSPQMKSETRAIWMALGLFCPEQMRIQMQHDRGDTQLTDLEIATRLRIPQQYVPHLFVPTYKAIMELLTKPAA